VYLTHENVSIMYILMSVTLAYMCGVFDVTRQSYMQSVQQQVAGASVGLLDHTTNDTPTDGATRDGLVFMTPIADIES